MSKARDTTQPQHHADFGHYGELPLSLLPSGVATGDIFYFSGGIWTTAPLSGLAGLGAPTTADYLVGTANAGLSDEIVVGTTPGGELGGTWAAPTVDMTHAGSAHTDAIAKAIVDAKGDLIAATAADAVARVAVGTDGYFLKADSGASTGVSWAAIAAADALSDLVSGTGDVTTTASLADVTGATLSLVSGTYIIHGTFDVLVNNALNDRAWEGHLDSGGSDQNDFANLVAPGLVNVRATVSQNWRLVLTSTTTVKLRTLHSGGTVGDFTVKSTNTTLAAYRAGGGAGDGGGIPATILDAKGDLIVASAADSAARLAVGTNTHVLTADASETLGVKWAAAAAPAPTWEDVVADLSGKVHRWKFEETSGTNVNDEISTLDLTLTGSVALAAASPLGNAISFTGGYAESSGVGSLPVGDAARTVLAVWKKTALGFSASLPIASYGTNTTRTAFSLYALAIGTISLVVWTDTLSAITGNVCDGQWHLSAAMNGTSRIGSLYHDGGIYGSFWGANLNTGTTNNFHVAAQFDDTNIAPLTVTDVIVFDRMLTKPELDRLYDALRVLLDGS